MKKEKILIINVCNEKLHYYEFVKPIEDILRVNKFKFFTKHYLKLKEDDLKKFSKAIICGTSLKDFYYFIHFDKFKWINKFDKPIFGICAGMQIIVRIFRGRIALKGKKIFNRTEIGMTSIVFKKEFLGLNGKEQVYELHQAGILNDGNKFNIFAASNKGVQAIKHKTKKIYGVLFHPEVRQKDLIINFCKI